MCWNLLPRRPQLDHYPFPTLVINGEMAMNDNTPVLLQVRPRNGLTPRMFGIERCIPQHDVLAVERAVALANRSRRIEES